MRFWLFNRFDQNDCVSWVTPSLAAGHAPMSHDHLDRLKRAGITSIINLCAEFPDLPLIEEQAGFDVYYLPIEDEEIPEIKNMDDALEWIDESIYLGKKVLVHCRHGIGRTGTIISAYLLRKGLSARLVRKKLKRLRSQPATYCQFHLLRKYGRSQCPLTTREPSLEYKNNVDLNPFFDDLETIFNHVETEISDREERCGREHMRCCRERVGVSFVEAVYISQKINTMLSREKRLALIGKAASIREERLVCTLSEKGKCTFYHQRPLACRIYDHENLSESRRTKIIQDAQMLSANLFLAFRGSFLDEDLVFDLDEVISGKYVQRFFHVKTANGQKKTNG